MDPLLGAVVNGKYHILDVAGSGGMGKIYRAEQIPLGRSAALKVLNPAYTSSSKTDDFQRRFFREASILSRLQHPNIVTVFDYGSIVGASPEMYFMAMEFLDGETLERRMRQCKTMSVAELLPIARQIARGLQDAHQHGVVHRDLKPSNVMLVPRPDGSALVKIVDFGLVKVLGDDSDKITREGTFLGSARYMSPEQIAHGKVDLRTDIYSLGVLMYEALCGFPPFAGDHLVQTLMAHINEPVPEMCVRNPEVKVPGAVEGFVRRCLSKFPEERPGNMDAVLAEIGVCARVLGLAPASADRYDVDSGAITRSGHFDRGDVDLATRAEPRPPMDVATRAEPGPTRAEESLLVPPKPATSFKLPLLIGGTAIAILLATVVVLALRSPPEAPTGPVAASSQPLPSSPRTFVLWIDSSPAGAEVMEGETVLGTTPMQVSIDNEVVRTSPKRLSVRSPGHLPYTLVQGPSDENVRVAASLSPLPQDAGSPKPTRGPAPRDNSTRTAPPPTSQPADPGIRLHR
jgi:serine/threonine-protein kinase